MTKELSNKLVDKLRDILDDSDFIIGVLSFCENDNNIKDVINKIDTEELTTSDQILLYAALLSPSMEIIEK